ncbi:hypothetical protein BC830DRAFT_1124152 [Chytriomyces sp. MP71]|nr:hypothetical protein BC830DRAFT_1124152 [Chytriomyces sp. MP71]
MSFIRGHDLKRHQRSVHSMGGRASVSCQNCGKTFTRLDSCKYHEATSCAAMLQKDT